MDQHYSEERRDDRGRSDRAERRSSRRPPRFPWDARADTTDRPSPDRAVDESPAGTRGEPGIGPDLPPSNQPAEGDPTPFPWDEATAGGRTTPGWDERPAATDPGDAVAHAGPGGRRITLGDGRQVELAGPGTRLLARFIDVVVLSIVVVIILTVGALTWAATSDDIETGVGSWIWTSLGIVLLNLLYEGSLIAARGDTIGKFTAGTKVVRMADGGVPGWRTSWRRLAIPGSIGAVSAAAGATSQYVPAAQLPAVLVQLVGGLAVVLCYLSLTWDTRRQGWHDKVAGTVVVTTERSRKGTGFAIAGLLFALIPLLPEILLTVMISSNPDEWLEGWSSLGTFLILIILTLISLGCWTGTVIFSSLALTRRRREHGAGRTIAIAGLCGLAAGLILLIILFQMVITA